MDLQKLFERVLKLKHIDKDFHLFERVYQEQLEHEEHQFNDQSIDLIEFTLLFFYKPYFPFICLKSDNQMRYFIFVSKG